MLYDDAGHALTKKAVLLYGTQLALARAAKMAQASVSLALKTGYMTPKFLRRLATALKRKKAGVALARQLESHAARLDTARHQ